MVDDSVVIERTFAASPEVIWNMWTDPQHFSAWYGPQGASIPVSTIDLRVGGKRHLCMETNTPNGPMTMWFVGEYLEIVEFKKLVYTESMSDAEGNVVSPTEMGLPEGHPATTEVIIDLEAVDGGTKLILTHVGVPADSPGAMGWNMAIDKLEALVATRTG